MDWCLLSRFVNLVWSWVLSYCGYWLCLLRETLFASNQPASLLSLCYHMWLRSLLYFQDVFKMRIKIPLIRIWIIYLFKSLVGLWLVSPIVPPVVGPVFMRSDFFKLIPKFETVFVESIPHFGWSLTGGSTVIVQSAELVIITTWIVFYAVHLPMNSFDYQKSEH